MIQETRFRLRLLLSGIALAVLCLLASGCAPTSPESAAPPTTGQSAVRTARHDQPGAEAAAPLPASDEAESAPSPSLPDPAGDNKALASGFEVTDSEPAPESEPTGADTSPPQPRYSAIREGQPASGDAGPSSASSERAETHPDANSDAADTFGLPGAMGGGIAGQEASRGAPGGGQGPGLEMLLQEIESVPASPAADPAMRPGDTSSRDRRAASELRARRSFELLPGEELWIIAREADTRLATNPDDRPGCGAMLAGQPGTTEMIPVPLKHTEVVGNIDGYIATVDVTQQFHNPYDSKIEAVYLFPLPENSAIADFVMTIGDRRIRGIIREREKAQQIYDAARQADLTVSMLTQERANVFTQKVANIEPGKQIDINIRYFHTLPYVDGEYEFVFPMVVGPRYNPPGSSDGIAAVARGTRSTEGQPSAVSYLAPHERSGHDVSVSLTINAGVPIEAVDCRHHVIDDRATSDCARHVTLKSQDLIPNRDFVVRYRVASDKIRTSLLTQTGSDGRYFTLMLYPPASLQQVRRSPLEMVFVLDCSGSMEGRPLEQARTAIAHALRQLTPRDTFQLIQFSDSTHELGSEPLPATAANVELGLRYLASMHSAGGTQMIEGVRAALDFPHDEGRFRLVCFMTDGYIGNEQQILETMADKMNDSRVFSFGVGNAPNRMLMDRMAILGRGAVAYLSLDDDAADVMNRFQERISHPAMTDLAIDFGNMQVTDVYPQRLPDLLVGRPVVITGRFTGEPSEITVGGRVEMEAASFRVTVSESTTSADRGGIASVWARLKIADLTLDATRDPAHGERIGRQILQTALDHNLMSAYTAFVAVDSLTVTEGNSGTTVNVAVPVPDGVRYDTTVNN